MIFRQLFDATSGTYTYILASRPGGEALIIDPVLEKVDRYLQLIRELDLKLVKAVDTHLHADHITGLGALRDRTHCITVMGENTKADVVSMRLAEGDRLEIEGLRLDVLYTPGHTDDSYSYLLADRVFTGDTLLIRGTGRTDFQNGDPRAQYDSIFNKLLKLPDATLVYPAHDYKGDTVSTIGEEKLHNPRLRVKSMDEYAELMNNLKLPNPKMMDVAVPANMRVGLHQEEVARKGWALTAAEAIALRGRPDIAIVDLREKSEREKHGVVPGALHAPYPSLQEEIGSGGMLHELATGAGKRIVFLCAFGERSAMAVQAAQDCRAQNRLPHLRRHRCLEKSERAAGAVTYDAAAGPVRQSVASGRTLASERCRARPMPRASPAAQRQSWSSRRPRDCRRYSTRFCTSRRPNERPRNRHAPGLKRRSRMPGRQQRKPVVSS